jgi:hypothetical protein
MMALLLPCLVIGDSIAVGVAAQLQDCQAVARVGASSSAIVRMKASASGGTAIISAGSNDAKNPKLEENLELIRRRAGAVRTVWIAPRHPKARTVVMHVAARHGDAVVDLAALPSRDGIHPAGYGRVARLVRAYAAR